MFLILPSNRISLVDYLIEKVPNWKKLESITFTTLAYTNECECSNFKQVGNVWTRERNLIGDDYLPSTSYEIKQIACDLYEILWIEYDGSYIYFSNKLPCRSVHITCKLSA